MRKFKIFFICFIAVLILIFLGLASKVVAQPLPDTNAVVHKVFATDADTIYGTFLGTLLFIIAVLIGAFVWLIRLFLPILKGIESALNNNTDTFASVRADMQRHQEQAQKAQDTMLDKLVSILALHQQELKGMVTQIVLDILKNNNK